MRTATSTVLYKWFNEVWNEDNEDAIDQLMTSESAAIGILTADQPKGPEGFKIFFRGFRSQFQSVRIEIDDVISQENMEAARTTVHAIHTQTGKNVTFSGMCMVRTKDGKIDEAWNNYDFLELYQQLGQKLTPVGEP
ncbi:ester cyclase [Spirosoma aureum]|uniref:Ester cyclase n=1 Tax=Spirosoma aureum TaxID=2692134 RepID=A0A6G9AR73_9BACT|nr:ester cyclase [Spirosoma aureum]QIP14834.1 ester cyclase [Spirosoma aureum]